MCCSASLRAVELGFALPPRLPLNRIRGNELRQASGYLLASGGVPGGACREGEGPRPAARSAASMAGDSGVSLRRSNVKFTAYRDKQTTNGLLAPSDLRLNHT